MSNNVRVDTRHASPSFFNRVPWTFLIIVYMVAVQIMELDMNGMAGYVFIGLGIFVLFAEFFKSGDINTTVFLIDVISAVTSVIVATALLSYLVFKLDQTPTFFHWFGSAIILGDAIISPFNAFRTALRNFGVGT